MDKFSFHYSPPFVLAEYYIVSSLFKVLSRGIRISDYSEEIRGHVRKRICFWKGITASGQLEQEDQILVKCIYIQIDGF